MTVAFTPQLLQNSAQRLRQGGTSPSGRTRVAGDDEARLGQLVSQMGGVVARHLVHQEQRRQQLENRQSIASAALGQQDFHYTFTKELAKVYRSDGTFAPPSKDYRHDLGWGLSLTYEDYYREGKRRSPVEIFKDKSAEYINKRKASAPTMTALTGMEIRMREQELRQQMSLDASQSSWTLASTGNAANQVVRSYKEQTARVKGHSPLIFSEHLKALDDVIAPAQEFADPGQVHQVFRNAVTDLVSAGVVEASTNQDNDFALRVLGHSSLRNSPRIRNALAGLPADERSFYGNLITRYAQGRKIYKMGSQTPGQPEQQLDWAIDQVDAAQLDKIQAKALEGLQAQTTVARQGLEGRAKGLAVAITQGGLTSTGLQNQISQSVVKGLQDVQRLYPKQFFPARNSALSAQFLAAGEILNNRKIFEQAPASMYPAIINQTTAQIARNVHQKMGADVGTAMQVERLVRQGLEARGAFIKKMREDTPLEALLSEDKSLARQYQRLNSPRTIYRDSAERVREQNFFKHRLLQAGVAKGVVPSFLSTTDRTTIENLGRLGAMDELFQTFQGLRNTYGDAAYFDYIAPEITKMKNVGLGSYLRPVALFKNASVGTYFLRARERAKGELTEEAKKVANADVVANSPERWAIVKNTIEQRLGRNAHSVAVLGDIQRMVRDVAVLRRLEGDTTNVGDNINWFMEDGPGLIGAGLDLVIHGLSGTLDPDIVEFDGEERIRPSKLTLSQPYLDELDDVVRDPQFLMNRVFPNLHTNAHYLNTARELGITPEQLHLRDFTDTSIVSWEFTEEGLMPMGEIPELGVSGSFIDKHKNMPFFLPYEELPSISVGY